MLINGKDIPITNNLELAEPWREFMSMADFALLIGRDPSVIRKHIANGKLIEGADCVRFGKQWVIHVPTAIKALFGDYTIWSNYLVDCRKDLIARGIKTY